MRKLFSAILGATIFSTITINAFAYENLTAKQFKEKLRTEKDYVLLDVRTPQEFIEDGHIKNANLIPVQIFQYVFLGGLKNKTFFVYCRSGRRSATASKLLEGMGIKKVYNLKGGIQSWKKAGFRVYYSNHDNLIRTSSR